MTHPRIFFPLVAWEVTRYYFSFLFLVWSWSQDRETKHLSHDWLIENTTVRSNRTVSFSVFQFFDRKTVFFYEKYVWKLFKLSSLVFIGIADRCLKSWLQKPHWKFLILPCIKWDLHLIQINLKVRLTNVSKSDGAIIAWLKMIKRHKRPYDKITRKHSFLFPLGTWDAGKLKCFDQQCQLFQRPKRPFLLSDPIILNKTTQKPLSSFSSGERTAEHRLLFFMFKTMFECSQFDWKKLQYLFFSLGISRNPPQLIL